MKVYKKIIVVTVLFMLIVLLFIMLSYINKPQPTQNNAYTFTDDLGYIVSVSCPKRVAAVSSSYARIWHLAGGQLAAVTEDAVYEHTLLSGNPENIGSVKVPNLEKMTQLNIDFVILSANIQKNVQLRDSIEKLGIKTAYFRVEDFDDYLRVLNICTDITGHKTLYQQNGINVKEKIEKQKQRCTEFPKFVLLIRSFSTGIKAKNSDSMTGKMLKDLGCVNIADDYDLYTENLNMEYIAMMDPEYIFVTTMGEDEEKAEKMVDKMLTLDPKWSNLSAVKQNKIYILPKELFHDKPNERWAESYKILADCLYGEENEAIENQ